MFTFKKSERITSLKEIDKLFERGNNSSQNAFPLRAVYQTYHFTPSTDGQHRPPRIKVLMSVAKKRLHHAVDRNRAKRQMREAYRLQHGALTQTLESLTTKDGDNTVALRIAFIWLSDTPQSSQAVSAAMLKILNGIEARLKH